MEPQNASYDNIHELPESLNSRVMGPRPSHVQMPNSSLLSELDRYSNQRQNPSPNRENTDLRFSDLQTSSILNSHPVQQNNLGYIPKWTTFYEDNKRRKDDASKTVSKEIAEKLEFAGEEEETYQTSKTENEANPDDASEIEQLRQDYKLAMTYVAAVDEKMSQMALLSTSSTQFCQEESKTSKNKFVNPRWEFKAPWDEAKDSFSQWFHMLRMSLRTATTCGIYLRQIEGSLSWYAMTEDQRELYEHRSDKMMECFWRCLRDTKMFSKFKHISTGAPDWSRQTMPNSEMVFQILQEFTSMMTQAEKDQIFNLVTRLSMDRTAGFAEYCQIGLYVEGRLEIAPDIMHLHVFFTRWVSGLTTDFEAIKVQMYTVMDFWKRFGDQFTLETVQDKIIQLSTSPGSILHANPVIFSGKNYTSALQKMMTISPQRPTQQGEMMMVNRIGVSDSADQDEHKFRSNPCTNKHCENPKSHGTDFCVSYGGKKEGQFNVNWAGDFKAKLQKRLDAKIKELGKSGSVQANSSVTMSKAGELSKPERAELIEQLISQTESEEKSAAQYQQLDNGEGEEFEY